MGRRNEKSLQQVRRVSTVGRPSFASRFVVCRRSPAVPGDPSTGREATPTTGGGGGEQAGYGRRLPVLQVAGGEHVGDRRHVGIHDDDAEQHAPHELVAAHAQRDEHVVDVHLETATGPGRVWRTLAARRAESGSAAAARERSRRRHANDLDGGDECDRARPSADYLCLTRGGRRADATVGRPRPVVIFCRAIISTEPSLHRRPGHQPESRRTPRARTTAVSHPVPSPQDPARPAASRPLLPSAFADPCSRATSQYVLVTTRACTGCPAVLCTGIGQAQSVNTNSCSRASRNVRGAAFSRDDDSRFSPWFSSFFFSFFPSSSCTVIDFSEISISGQNGWKHFTVLTFGIVEK